MLRVLLRTRRDERVHGGVERPERSRPRLEHAPWAPGEDLLIERGIPREKRIARQIRDRTVPREEPRYLETAERQSQGFEILPRFETPRERRVDGISQNAPAL